MLLGRTLTPRQSLLTGICSHCPAPSPWGLPLIFSPCTSIPIGNRSLSYIYIILIFSSHTHNILQHRFLNFLRDFLNLRSPSFVSYPMLCVNVHLLANTCHVRTLAPNQRFPFMIGSTDTYYTLVESRYMFNS